MARLSIHQLQIIGDELAIAWSDGKESYFKLEHLRRACPCAACAGEPDGLIGMAKPEVHYNDKSFVLRSCERVGGYALQPYWDDGHQTGLFSYDYLRSLEQPNAGSDTPAVP